MIAAKNRVLVVALTVALTTLVAATNHGYYTSRIELKRQIEYQRDQNDKGKAALFEWALSAPAGHRLSPWQVKELTSATYVDLDKCTPEHQYLLVAAQVDGSVFEQNYLVSDYLHAVYEWQEKFCKIVEDYELETSEALPGNNPKMFSYLFGRRHELSEEHSELMEFSEAQIEAIDASEADFILSRKLSNGHHISPEDAVKLLRKLKVSYSFALGSVAKLLDVFEADVENCANRDGLEYLYRKTTQLQKRNYVLWPALQEIAVKQHKICKDKEEQLIVSQLNKLKPQTRALTEQLYKNLDAKTFMQLELVESLKDQETLQLMLVVEALKKISIQRETIGERVAAFYENFGRHLSDACDDVHLTLGEKFRLIEVFNELDTPILTTWTTIYDACKFVPENQINVERLQSSGRHVKVKLLGKPERLLELAQVIGISWTNLVESGGVERLALFDADLVQKEVNRQTELVGKSVRHLSGKKLCEFHVGNLRATCSHFEHMQKLPWLIAAGYANGGLDEQTKAAIIVTNTCSALKRTGFHRLEQKCIDKFEEKKGRHLLTSMFSRKKA